MESFPESVLDTNSYNFIIHKIKKKGESKRNVRIAQHLCNLIPFVLQNLISKAMPTTISFRSFVGGRITDEGQ